MSVEKKCTQTAHEMKSCPVNSPLFSPIHHRGNRKSPNYRIHCGALVFCGFGGHSGNSRLLLFTGVFAVVECSLLPFGNPEHSCSKNHGHYHRSQAQGWIDGLRHADPHHAKGCNSLSGKPDVRTELFPHLLIVQPLTTHSGSQLFSTS